MTLFMELDTCLECRTEAKARLPDGELVCYRCYVRDRLAFTRQYVVDNGATWRESAQRTNHIRWHVNRGLRSERCGLCRDVGMIQDSALATAIALALATALAYAIASACADATAYADAYAIASALVSAPPACGVKEIYRADLSYRALFR